MRFAPIVALALLGVAMAQTIAPAGQEDIIPAQVLPLDDPTIVMVYFMYIFQVPR
jgi:hypothetical protein